VEGSGISYISLLCKEKKKMRGYQEVTIAAIATPAGEGAISVIRLSGETAFACIANRFKGKHNLTEVQSHTAHYGYIVEENGKIIDEVVCTVFRGPHSFTGEDTVEISCHGGIHVTRRVLECLIYAGARSAKPGEFTQRAFLNGKLDLSQAEAIADLIQAQSDKSHRTALNQLEGSLSKQIHAIREQLVTSLGLLEMELDFVEDDIDLIDKIKFTELLEREASAIDWLLSTYKYGKIVRDGISVALVGVPNAGKSSLLNALLNEQRAIVTNIPGTTRDFIEEKILLEGILFRLIDTAGLRETHDPIEEEGVSRTWKIIKNAEIILLVHDFTMPFLKEEIQLIESAKTINPNLKALLIANNKIDLALESKTQIHQVDGCSSVKTSALCHTGLEDLKKALIDQVLGQIATENMETVTITNKRHYGALLRAKESLTAALESTNLNESNEFIAVNLRAAIDSIGEIVGIVTTEDILNSIFSKFCIGK
jgi:tRNA modification GTPase